MTNDKHLQDVEEALEACAAPLETRIRSWFKWWCRAMTLAREVRRLRSELDRARKDSERLDKLERLMSPDDNYVEIYLAGCRNWTGKANVFQVESGPEKYQTVQRPTLREAVDAFGYPPDCRTCGLPYPNHQPCCGAAATKEDR